jgi:hypothetical protein
MPYAVVAGVIGAAGSIIGGSEQASGQKQAAQTQLQMFNTITGQEQPFLNAGYGAENTLQELMSGNPGTTVPGTNLPGGYLTQTFNPTQQQLENYPGYQFQLSQGDLALQNANSPTGSALGGSTLKQLMGFNQGLAGTNYSNYFNQFQTQQNNIFNRLNSIAQLGQNAAGNLGNAGTQLGTGIAQAQAAAAGSIAGGIAGATNSLGNNASLYALLNGGFGGSQPYTVGTAAGGYNVNSDLAPVQDLQFSG